MIQDHLNEPPDEYFDHQESEINYDLLYSLISSCTSEHPVRLFLSNLLERQDRTILGLCRMSHSLFNSVDCKLSTKRLKADIQDIITHTFTSHDLQTVLCQVTKLSFII